jgi:hypothetical protein
METKLLPYPSELVKWLRHMAERGGKGTVDNVDARSLGRVADALERTIPTEGEARELVGRLHVEMIARCNCNVKSPELQHHNKGCTFRVLGDAASYIERTAQAQVTDDRKLANVAGQMWSSAEDEVERLTKMLRLATETLAGLSPDFRSTALDEIIRDCRAALNPKPEVSK